MTLSQETTRPRPELTSHEIKLLDRSLVRRSRRKSGQTLEEFLLQEVSVAAPRENPIIHLISALSRL